MALIDEVQMAGAANATTRGRLSYRVMPWPLLFVLVSYLSLALIYTASTPPFEGPDEPQHFAYVQWLVRANRLPPQGDAAWETGIEQESSQPPFYYFLASLPARVVGLEDPEAVFRPNPNFLGPIPRDFPDNDNWAIHYPDDVSRLAGGWLSFYLARAVSMLFGILLLFSVYHLIRTVISDRPHIALLSTLFVGAIPQVIYLGSVVSNDIPVAALSTTTLWLLARLIRNGYTRGRAVVLGAVMGLAVLTKVSAGVLAVPVGLGIFWVWYKKQLSVPDLIRMGVWTGGTALLVAGWWFARGWMLYGSPLGLETHDVTNWAITQPEDVDLAWRRWWEVFRSAWIWLGWGTVRPNYDVYEAIFAMALVALAGLGLNVYRWRQERNKLLADGPVLLFLLVLFLVSSAVFLEIWMHRVVAPYGRLLYPAIGVIAVLLILGWHALHRVLPLIPIVFLMGLSVLTPTEVIRPAYRPPQPLTLQEVAALKPTLSVRFGPTAENAFAELVHLDVQKRSAQSGEMIPVRLCWRTLGTADRDYSILAHVVGPQNRVVAGRRTYPGLGAFPTSTWQAGSVFCDLVQIKVPEKQTIEPLVYDVEIAMIDQSTGQRLPIFDGNGNLMESAFLAKVHVHSDEAGGREASLTPGGPALQLVGSTVENRAWRAGQTASFSLRWAAASAVDKDYQVFVHLRDPQSGDIVDQADGPPVDGWYPTSWWPTGETIVDERLFAVGEDVPPGAYDLVAGLYDLQNGQRFGDEYDLGTVTVEK